MKILSLIGLYNTGPRCQQCTHFKNDPAFIEETYAGLTAFSSGFASVRDQDGFCNYHELYLSSRDSCPHFELCKTVLHRSATEIDQTL